MEKQDEELGKCTPISVMTSAAMFLGGGLWILFILFSFYDFVHFSIGIVFCILSILVSIGMLVVPGKLEKAGSNLCVHTDEVERRLDKLVLRWLSGGGVLVLLVIWMILNIHFMWSLGAALWGHSRPAGLGTWFSTGWLMISMASIVVIMSSAFIFVVYKKFKKPNELAETVAE